MAVETTHRFKRDWIETRWKVMRRKRQRYSADVLFPSWGKAATIEAVLFDGTRKALTAPGVPRSRVQLKNVRYFYLAGKETDTSLFRSIVGARRILKPKRQAGAPDPGTDARGRARPPRQVQAARLRGSDRTERQPKRLSRSLFSSARLQTSRSSRSPSGASAGVAAGRDAALAEVTPAALLRRTECDSEALAQLGDAFRLYIESVASGNLADGLEVGWSLGQHVDQLFEVVLEP